MGDIGHERVLVFDPGESTGWVFGIDDYPSRWWYDR